MASENHVYIHLISLMISQDFDESMDFSILFFEVEIAQHMASLFSQRNMNMFNLFSDLKIVASFSRFSICENIPYHVFILKDLELSKLIFLQTL